jgi:hypothetical protein
MTGIPRFGRHVRLNSVPGTEPVDDLIDPPHLVAPQAQPLDAPPGNLEPEEGEDQAQGRQDDMQWASVTGDEDRRKRGIDLPTKLVERCLARS